MKQEDVGNVIDRSFKAQSFIDNHAMRITDHYHHAREKHPYFCDGILSFVEDYERALANQRLRLAAAKSCRMVAACDLIDCELLEAYVEAANGKNTRAVEELYDAIAVCLRAIDVLEGRQPLGKPKTIVEKYAEVRQRKESGEPHSPPMSARAQVQAMVEN